MPTSPNNKRSFSQYNIIQSLGHGAYGSVYLCTDNKDKTQKPRAVKVIDKKKVRPQQVQQLFTERAILVQPENKTPWTVRGNATFQDRSYLYFDMEFCQGGDLLWWLNQQPHAFLDGTKGQHYTAQLISAVISLHQKGYIHRDLKPDNIFIDNKTGRLKLADFGYSKRLNNNSPNAQLLINQSSPSQPCQARALSQVGTPSYIAPEIFAAQPYDHRVDWWSVGIIIYQMLFGTMPEVCIKKDNQMTAISLGEIFANPMQLLPILTNVNTSKYITLPNHEGSIRVNFQLPENTPEAYLYQLMQLHSCTEYRRQHSLPQVPEEAKALILNFLTSPAMRYGQDSLAGQSAAPNFSTSKMMNHPYFDGIQWQKLAKQQGEFRMPTSDPKATPCIDKDCTTKMPCKPPQKARQDIMTSELFEAFSFENDSLEASPVESPISPMSLGPLSNPPQMFFSPQPSQQSTSVTTSKSTNIGTSKKARPPAYAENDDDCHQPSEQNKPSSCVIQ